MDLTLLPLAIVAILIWAGVFAFVYMVDKKIAAIERRIEDRERERERDE